MATVGASTAKDSAMFIATANALAGAVGGIIAMTIVFPLDIIRTQLQAKATEIPKEYKITDSQSALSSPSKHADIDEEEMEEEKTQSENDEFIVQKKQMGIKQVIQRIYAKEGIAGFYRALSSQLICIFVSDMVYFFAVTLIKQVLYGKREVDAMSNLKASTIAGIVNVFITSPFWRAQVQLMLQSKKRNKRRNAYATSNGHREEDEEDEEEGAMMNGLLDAWKKIMATDGVGGLYKGIGPSLWLVSNPIIQFVVYEEVVNVLKGWSDTQQLSALTYFLCGAFGKAVATVFTYPLQVMQTQLRKKDSEFKDMKDCINNFAIPKIRKGDFGPLFSGLSAKLYQTVSNSAIKFMIYEEVLVFIKAALRWMQKTLVALIFMMFVSKTNSLSKATVNAST
mmetsp:Transcript_61478/g.97921  ORF Transcript_61478/g.97921 Transcript_61478/m.97921 type:complete len:396 (+) Transcript_61478:26-1213(+)|eukprot:CAMPEP_0197028808 /NCGR_PEP_ID=MMETSP1384-20130603/8410_1 /TAXON_ID=29189 /ORGANISM="Ammonia sp." /LENGTH=395 /DNA_ID=CAMNT_0042457867 /DNA_START=18 /DNA_END=1205 /DNA_ORIENTATION=+